MHTTFLLLSLVSILSETKSNLRILCDFIFQINLDFISNSNFNPSELLPHPCISSRAPLPCIPMPVLPQNQTLTATQAPPHRRCPSQPPPLFWCPPFQFNPVLVVRSQEPNHRRKNHVKSHSVASTIYHWSLAVVSHRGCNFFGELEVNPTPPVSSSSIAQVIANSDELLAKFRWANSIVVFYLELWPNFTNRSLCSFYLITY
jgi:hypothetical protein